MGVMQVVGELLQLLVGCCDILMFRRGDGASYGRTPHCSIGWVDWPEMTGSTTKGLGLVGGVAVLFSPSQGQSRGIVVTDFRLSLRLRLEIIIKTSRYALEFSQLTHQRISACTCFLSHVSRGIVEHGGHIRRVAIQVICNKKVKVCRC